MVQINKGAHASPHAGDPQLDFIPFPAQHHSDMDWALAKANWIVANKPQADIYFSGLTAGSRTLTALLADNTMWVNYSNATVNMGETPGTASGFSLELGIGAAAFKWGRWSVLATFIHELAHCNGDRSPTSTAAEDSLVHCGLGTMDELTSGVDDPSTPYQPGVQG